MGPHMLSCPALLKLALWWTPTPVLVNLRTLGLFRTPGHNNGGQLHAGRTLLPHFELEMQSSESSVWMRKKPA